MASLKMEMALSGSSSRTARDISLQTLTEDCDPNNSTSAVVVWLVNARDIWATMRATSGLRSKRILTLVPILVLIADWTCQPQVNQNTHNG